MLAEHRARPFDAIYAQGLGAWGIARMVPRLGARRPRFVCFHHGMEEFKNPDWRKRLLYAPFRAAIRSATRRAAVVIVTDDGARREARELLGFAPAAFAVVPAGIDLAEIASLHDDALVARWAEQLDVAHRRPLILSVARLEANKGIDVAIDALAHAASALGEGWRWAVVGEGSLRGALESRARERGIAAHVTFLGNVSDAELHNLYPLADLFVHPTLFEGTSLVTVEAMAHRLPIVASRAGGIPEKIESERNGVLVPPGDARELGAAIARVLARPDRGRALGEAARADAERRFDWPRVVAGLIAALSPEGNAPRAA
ncbi:MAG: glycosyltransferase family 4 protein [bacterium]